MKATWILFFPIESNHVCAAVKIPFHPPFHSLHKQKHEQMSALLRLTLFTKTNCGLCVTAKEALTRVQAKVS